MTVAVRPATGADLDFILRVHAESMRPHIEAQWGVWDEQQQRERIFKSTRPETHRIIEAESKPVGCYWIREHPGELELVRLYLLAPWQGRGIGSSILGDLCAEADGLGLPMRLRVLQKNPARRLYERFGFRVIDQTDSHRIMRRKP
jgi:GNAT superfamily N-acetyltransferase